MTRLANHACKVTAYRTTAVGFAAQNPQFFIQQPSNAIEITDLRMQFKIEKSLEKTPNRCEVTITNCSSTTRAFLQTKPLVVRIDAGDDDNIRHLFTGDLRHGYSKIDGTEWLTVLELADGDRAYRNARVSRSYGKGTSVVTALKEAAAAMGLQLSNDILASADLQKQFATGRTLHGPAREELTRLLAPFGYNWSIQDGRMQILKDQNASATTAWVITQDTGRMVGSPEYTTPDKETKPPLLKIKARLFPELTPGGSISVASRDVQGLFRINKLTHTGDTHGDDWDTETESSPRPGSVST